MSQYILGLSYNKLIFFIMFFDAESYAYNVLHYRTTFYNILQ